MNSSQQKILRKSQVETSDVSGRNEPSSYAMLQEVTISDGSVSCVRNKQFDHECSQPKSTTEWGVQILNELHAMGIEILKFTERDFGARLSRKRETTLRERTTELLTVLGMTAYAISQNRLWDLGCELGNQLGRWIHKDANIPGLGLEVAYGYSPQLGSARGKIVLVAIQRKFTAHDLTRYINECGGLDNASDNLRRAARSQSPACVSKWAQHCRRRYGSSGSQARRFGYRLVPATGEAIQVRQSRPKVRKT